MVDLNETFYKHEGFRPVVVLKNKVEGDRKMLPNSFLNRFVKLHLGEFKLGDQLAYLWGEYPSVPVEIRTQVQQLLQTIQAQSLSIKLK